MDPRPHRLRHLATCSLLVMFAASAHGAPAPGGKKAAALAKPTTHGAAPDKKPSAPAVVPSATTIEAESDAAASGNAVIVDSRVARHRVPTAAVVVLSNAAGRPFDGAVDRFLLRYLSSSLHVAPMKATHQAVARVHGNARTLHSPATLMAVGRRMNVPYVLVVEAIGKRRPTHVFVGLVDVHSSKTVLAHREALRGGRLDNVVGRKLAERLSDALAAQNPRSARPPVRDDDMEPPTEAEAKTPVAKGDDKALGAADEEGETPKKKGHGDGAGHGRRDKDVEDDASRLEKGLVRNLIPKARLFAGFRLMQRVSRLKTPAVNGVSPPCYCGNKSNAQPFFPAFFGGGELSTGLFTHGRRRPQDGIGVYAEALVAPVKTRVIRDGTSTNVSSTVFGMDVGAFYRLAWFPKKILTPDIRLNLGLNRFVFPLKNTQYTGVNYGAFNVGLNLDVPFHKTIGAFAGLDLRPGLKAGKQATSLLGQPKAGFGIGAHAGLRGGVSLFSFELAFHFDRYQVPFSGQTNLPNMPVVANTTEPVQFSNVKLTDQLLSILLRLGIAI